MILPVTKYLHFINIFICNVTINANTLLKKNIYIKFESEIDLIQYHDSLYKLAKL